MVVLQRLLRQWGYAIEETGFFDTTTDTIVKLFQTRNGLTPDGIVGPMSWAKLQDDTARKNSIPKLTEADFVRAAKTLGVSVAAIKAVKEVETGGMGGFLAIDRASILFEGHIFWSQLKKNGVDPAKHVKGNEDILYQKWSKAHYKGGINEYKRLSRAMAINEKAALCSASWGLFQIMGFNYTICGCESVNQFVGKMMESEGAQLDLFVAFIKGNGWHKYLKSLDWASFAKNYNGLQCAENKYDQ